MKFINIRTNTVVEPLSEIAAQSFISSPDWEDFESKKAKSKKAEPLKDGDSDANNSRGK